jgi:hypothetical protein
MAIGFPYRLFRHADVPSYTRLSFGCVASSKSSSSLSMPLSPSSLKTHPLVSYALSHSPSQLPLNSSSQTPHCPDIIITFTNRFFYETAIGLKQALEQASQELHDRRVTITSSLFPLLTIRVWSDMNIALLLPLDHCPRYPLQISIAPHEDTPLMRRYIVFHLEQSWSFFLQSERYITLLKGAQAVWTFTTQQTPLLMSFGVDPKKIWCLPVYTDRRYLLSTYRVYHTINGNLAHADDTNGSPSQEIQKEYETEDEGQHYDILLFGSSSSRRLRFVEEFTRNISTFSQSISFYRLISGAQHSLMGKRRDRIVRTSKVQITPPPLPLDLRLPPLPLPHL